MADTMTVGKVTNISPEVTHGTAPGGGAVHTLLDTVVALDPNYSSTDVRGSGRRFLSAVAPNGQEYSSGKLSGAIGYISWPYFLSMAWGAATVTTPAGGVNARKWVWSVPLSGSINPVSSDIEVGDSLDADQFLYCVCDSIGFDATRQAVSPSGSLIARATNKLTPNGTFAGMAVSPTALAVTPVLGQHWSVFMDYTSANLGSTKLTRAFHAKLDYGPGYQPFFPMDNALPSYGGIADGDAVKTTLLIEMMKSATVDTTGSEALWPSARSGFKRFVRVTAGGVGVSPLIDNYMTLTTTGVPTGGTFTLSYKGQTTAGIAWNAAAAAVQTALLALSTIGTGNVVCAGGTLPAAITITFAGTLANDATLITIGTNALTGGASPTPVIVSTQIPYSMQYDMCAEVSSPGANKDLTGLRTREWSFGVVEDPTWGNALVVTMITSLATLT